MATVERPEVIRNDLINHLLKRTEQCIDARVDRITQLEIQLDREKERLFHDFRVEKRLQTKLEDKKLK